MCRTNMMFFLVIVLISYLLPVSAEQNGLRTAEAVESKVTEATQNYISQFKPFAKLQKDFLEHFKSEKIVDFTESMSEELLDYLKQHKTLESLKEDEAIEHVINELIDTLSADKTTDQELVKLVDSLDAEPNDKHRNLDSVDESKSLRHSEVNANA